MQTHRSGQTRWEFSNSLANWVCYNWSNLGLSFYHTKKNWAQMALSSLDLYPHFLHYSWCCGVQSRCMILTYLQVVWSIAWNIPHWEELQEAITNNRVPLDLLSIYVCRCISMYLCICIFMHINFPPLSFFLSQIHNEQTYSNPEFVV